MSPQKGRVAVMNSVTSVFFTDTATTRGMPNTRRRVSITTDRILEEPCEVTSLMHGFEAERRGRPLRLGSGYGSGIATATMPDYGDVVLADLTQAFNESDVSYYLPLSIQTVAVLGHFPRHVT